MKSKVKALLLAFALSVGVTACSWSDAVKGIGAVTGITEEKPLVGVDTEVGDDTVVVGERIETTTEFNEVGGNVAVTNHQERNTVDKAGTVTYNEFSPMVMIIIGFLSVFGMIGWMLPSWSELWRRLRNKEN